MHDEITIHIMGPDDLRRLLSVPDGLFDNPMISEQAEAFLNDPRHKLILAYAGDLAVGMASGTILLHPDKLPAMLINEIGVRETYQRRGIGSSMTKALIDLARTEGCKGIWLGTEADNVAALALYRSLAADELQGVYFGWDDAF